MTIEGENGWVFVNDSFGDWRGTNETMGLRTRLKRDTKGSADTPSKSGLEWVKHDIAIGRLQFWRNSAWDDAIDRPDKTYV